MSWSQGHSRPSIISRRRCDLFHKIPSYVLTYIYLLACIPTFKFIENSTKGRKPFYDKEKDLKLLSKGSVSIERIVFISIVEIFAVSLLTQFKRIVFDVLLMTWHSIEWNFIRQKFQIENWDRNLFLDHFMIRSNIEITTEFNLTTWSFIFLVTEHSKRPILSANITKNDVCLFLHLHFISFLSGSRNNSRLFSRLATLLFIIHPLLSHCFFYDFLCAMELFSWEVNIRLFLLFQFLFSHTFDWWK